MLTKKLNQANGVMNGYAYELIAWLLRGFLTVGLFTNIGVTIDRYWAVSYPFSYRSQFSRKFTILLIVIYWILGFSNGSLLLLEIDRVHWWYCLIVGLISLVVFITLNFLLYREIKKKISSPISDRQMERDIRLTKTIVIILFVYFILLCPFFLVEFFYKLCHYETVLGLEMEQLSHISRILIILNCSLNSIIYAYRVKVIRDQIKIILKCYQKVNSSVESGRKE